jgi:hypothetical protein
MRWWRRRDVARTLAGARRPPQRALCGMSRRHRSRGRSRRRPRCRHQPATCEYCQTWAGSRSSQWSASQDQRPAAVPDHAGRRVRLRARPAPAIRCRAGDPWSACDREPQDGRDLASRARDGCPPVAGQPSPSWQPAPGNRGPTPARRGGTARLLRLPRRALGPPAHDQSDIEPTFATVRHRTKVTRGPGSRAAGLAMAFKLIESAQERWRAVNAPHLVALVRAGAASKGANSSNAPGRTRHDLRASSARGRRAAAHRRDRTRHRGCPQAAR